ncbi:hypothetical protein KUTeg_001684 [Tegillarca granosa]|uniref:Major facilitator superfamily (MFS) profile domain-containing protein n=1 Tax=Tegillarca granosa TaxID=220873 RepID=A0ABQ9FVT9_TEGGR|nr:hypothetical protein KUTeg_001684 [Tegillarca granosa]
MVSFFIFFPITPVLFGYLSGKFGGKYLVVILTASMAILNMMIPFCAHIHPYIVMGLRALSGICAGAREEWQVTFYICVCVSVGGAIFYAVFASGEEQDWAKNTDGGYENDMNIKLEDLMTKQQTESNKTITKDDNESQLTLTINNESDPQGITTEQQTDSRRSSSSTTTLPVLS